MGNPEFDLQKKRLRCPRILRLVRSIPQLLQSPMEFPAGEGGIVPYKPQEFAAMFFQGFFLGCNPFIFKPMLDRLFKFLQLHLIDGKMDKAVDGGEKIHQQDCQQNPGNGAGGGQGNGQNLFFQPGMDEVGAQCSHHAKADGAAKEDAAVEIEPFLGIVPPAGVEQHFQKPAGKVFHHRHNHHAGKEQGNPGGGPGLQQVHNQHSAHAVYRTQGAVQESPVDEAPVADGAITCLPQPPDETVCQKQHEKV